MPTLRTNFRTPLTTWIGSERTGVTAQPSRCRTAGRDRRETWEPEAARDHRQRHAVSFASDPRRAAHWVMSPLPSSARSSAIPRAALRSEACPGGLVKGMQRWDDVSPCVALSNLLSNATLALRKPETRR